MKAGEVEVGSLVVLEIGGPMMVVTDHEAMGDRFHCVWFDKNDGKQEHWFNRKLLILQ